MIFDWLNAGSPFFWCFVGSVFLGAAISRISRRALGPRRWGFVYIYLTVAVASAAAGVLVPGSAHFLDIRLAYFSAAWLAIGFLGFRYAVAIGVPLLLICVVVLAVLGVTLRGWLPLHGQSEKIGTVRIFDAGATRVDLEVRATAAAGTGTVTGALPSGGVAPIVEVLRFNSSYFFVSSPILYRLDGVATSGTSSSPHNLALVKSRSGVVRFLSRLPGVVHKTVVGSASSPRPLQDYSVILDDSLQARLAEAQS